MSFRVRQICSDNLRYGDFHNNIMTALKSTGLKLSQFNRGAVKSSAFDGRVRDGVLYRTAFTHDNDCVNSVFDHWTQVSTKCLKNFFHEPNYSPINNRAEACYIVETLLAKHSISELQVCYRDKRICALYIYWAEGFSRTAFTSLYEDDDGVSLVSLQKNLTEHSVFKDTVLDDLKHIEALALKYEIHGIFVQGSSW